MDSSHQDELLGRYPGPAREVYWGNPTLCAPYVNVGRKLLGYLKNTLGNSGVEVGSKYVRMPDGTKIVAHVDGVNHVIHIDVRERRGGEQRDISVFVETGWVNLLNLANNEVPITYSFLYYGARQYAALATEFPKWLDEIVFTLDEDDVITHKREGLVRTPHAPTHANYPPQNYIESIGFQTYEDYDGEGHPDFAYTRTEACETPNPGYCTGRLKLYVQALLGGIKNKKFIFDVKNKVDPWSAKVTEIVQAIMGSRWGYINAAIAFAWDYSRGLYVTDDYQYWLLSIIGTSVYAQQLMFSPAHAILRKSYLEVLQNPATSRLERSKIEAYILSGCVEFGPSILVAENILAPFQTDGDKGGNIGDTVHEGWKFNYKGDEAQIVMDELTWKINPSTLINTINRHIFRRYKLAFSYTENSEAPFTVTLSKIEEVTATPEDKCLRPVKWDISAGHSGQLEWQDWHELVLMAPRGYLDGWIEFDAPIYCWYMMNEAGEESLITVRNIVKWPDSTGDAAADYSSFINGLDVDSFYVCGVGSARVQNLDFKDQVGAKRGYYLRVESGPGTGIHNDLLESVDYYEHAVHIIDARIDTVQRGVTTYRSEWTNGGYLNLGFPSGALTCDGTYATLPPEMVGGQHVDVTAPKGTYESLRYIIDTTGSSSVYFGHTLIFPYNDGSSVYIQRDKKINGAAGITHLWGWVPSMDWSGVAVFSDGHTAEYSASLRWRNSVVTTGVSTAYIPAYPDLRFYVEYPAGTLYASYGGTWVERRDSRKLYYASANNSELIFDETATNHTVQNYNMPHNVAPPFTFPAEGVETDLCFGKHNWYVVNDLIEFDPWFEPTTPLLESYNGDAMTLQQWGPFEDRTVMPDQPIYHVTDPLYPLFESDDGFTPAAVLRQFYSTFIGWA